MRHSVEQGAVVACGGVEPCHRLSLRGGLALMVAARARGTPGLSTPRDAPPVGDPCRGQHRTARAPYSQPHRSPAPRRTRYGAGTPSPFARATNRSEWSRPQGYGWCRRSSTLRPASGGHGAQPHRWPWRRGRPCSFVVATDGPRASAAGWSAVQNRQRQTDKGRESENKCRCGNRTNFVAK